MTGAARSAVPFIPREVLFGNPERTQPRLSPGGERLAYIAPLDGVLNVWIGPVGPDAGGGGFEPVTRDEGSSEADHALIWMVPEEAAARLRHESQRWAISEACRLEST